VTAARERKKRSLERMTAMKPTSALSDRPPTTHDVAALAGVGRTTVSRVLNGSPGVSAATAARVVAAIERLDYRHNVTASSLRRSDQKTRTIGLVLPSIMNPFMGALARAVEDAVRMRGMLVFAGSCDEDGEREREFVEALRSHRVDGMIIVPASADHSYLLSEQQRGTALIFVDRPARFLDADFVASDNVEGARNAVSHLATHGHRRIAFLGAKLAIATAEERLRGYEEGLARQGIPLDSSLVRTGLTGLRGTHEVESTVAELLQRRDPPTALFSSLDLFTIEAIDALRTLGLQHQVALVGFDDFPLANRLDPPVTIIAQDAMALGRTAAELLFSRLDGDSSPTKQIRLPVELIARGSGEIMPPVSSVTLS
jgi:LacI family transcriptional regulator